MVKKFFLIITVFLLTLNISNAYAIRDDYKFDGNYIEDYANLFDDNIEREKNNYFNSLSNQYNVPVYIYTVNESHSYTSRELSDELLYQRVGIDKNGILLLIDMYNSEIYITASGDYAIKIMDDSRQEELIDVIAPMIRSKPNQ
ncbi:MAG: TPM domain-containing protein, partial [Helcococcus sp.]|nr:TPM domain-containing protein [Helcococcus sp.]